MHSDHSIARLALAAACLFTNFLLLGCATTTHVPDSVLTRSSGNDDQQQLDYWHDVATKQLIGNDEAFHGLLLYIDGKDDATTYNHRVASLKSRGYLPKSFNHGASDALERGTVAVALAKHLKLRGGLTMRLTGVTPRYATRELEYRGVYPPSSPQQIFTGAEFVGVIGKAEDFRRGDPTDLPAAAPPADVAPTPTEVARADPDAFVHPIFAMILQAPRELTLQTPATAPATTQAGGPLKIIITAVDGLASVRENENTAWKPAKIGMELTQDAEFRTGPRGTIQFRIPPDQTVSVDRLTTLKVLQVIQQGGKVTTDLGIKYGRTRYDLEGGGVEHQSTLRSPNATLAVRGTKVSLFDQPPFAPQAISLTGRAEFAAHRRKPIAFGRAGQGKTIVNADSQTAGDVALASTVVDPTLMGARTDSEIPLLTTVISRGATTTIDPSSGIRIVRGGIPPTDAQLAGNLPGRLSFVLRWNGDADLNLGVSTPNTDMTEGGEIVLPVAGLNIAPSGGRTAFDHRGGPAGGIEVVYFNKFPDGLFAIGGMNLSQTTVTATIDAYLDNQKLDLFDGTQVTQTVTQTVSPNQPALALAGVNTPLPFVEPPVLPPDLPEAQSRPDRAAKKARPMALPGGPIMGPMPAKKR
jgi:hypothetical protein